ncbi:MAG TPA: hypothetical protein VNY30_10720 [Bryobacteraceae bacterium]|nr:hypothetical protein [Bryobacteraceae bacterium]
MSRKFGKTAHHQVNVGSPIFIDRLGANLRIDVGYASFRSVHARRELVFINHALGKTIDQALHPMPQLLTLRLQGIDIPRRSRTLVAVLLLLLQASRILQNLAYVLPDVGFQ